MELLYSSRNHSLRGYEVTFFIGDLDLYNIEKGVKEMNYYNLPKDKRWLEEDSPYKVGGRDTDIGFIASTLSHRVRELFPINQVPASLVIQLNNLQNQCDECEKEIQRVIECIGDTIDGGQATYE